MACSSTFELIDVATAFLDQLEGVLKQVKDEDLIFPSKNVEGTIGQHFRHIIQHFMALTTAANSLTSSDAVETPTIHYDIRARHLDMEKQSSAALDALEKTKKDLQSIKHVNHAHPFLVSATILPNQPPMLMSSTLERELWFVCHHLLHHCALIRAILVEKKITPPKDFGVAPSTIQFRTKTSM